ncbi:MAG: M28 family peptidase [Candidatus Polarisedimenticolia bacterium]
MKEALRSLARVAAGVVVGVALLIVCAGLLLRMPTIGSDPFPGGTRADPELLRAHVEHLSTKVGPRSANTPGGLDLAVDYITSSFSSTHAVVSRQEYEVGRGSRKENIMARFGPEAGRRVILGAHYDAYGDFPGADDNASGTAGLLEIARLLDTRKLTSPVELVAYSTEEPPFFGGAEMGSAAHARSLRSTGVEVEAMICLEMIGYFTPRQPVSTPLLYLMYPWRGDFVVIVGRWKDRSLARRCKRSFRGATDVRAVSYSGPVGFGSDLSDHRNYWAEGYPAVMVTDTAFWRNPNYHSAADLPETLDYRRMAGVVDGVLATVLHLVEDMER